MTMIRIPHLQEKEAYGGLSKAPEELSSGDAGSRWVCTTTEPIVSCFSTTKSYSDRNKDSAQRRSGPMASTG